MFKTVKRIIDWCGEFKGRLYAGFVVSFFLPPVHGAAHYAGGLHHRPAAAIVHGRHAL